MFLAKQMVEKKSFLSCPYQNISQQQQQNILSISLSISLSATIQDQQKKQNIQFGSMEMLAFFDQRLQVGAGDIAGGLLREIH